MFNKNKSKVLSSGNVSASQGLNYGQINHIQQQMNKLDSKLNAIQLHLGIEIVNKVILGTHHQVIKKEKQNNAIN